MALRRVRVCIRAHITAPNNEMRLTRASDGGSQVILVFGRAEEAR